MNASVTRNQPGRSLTAAGRPDLGRPCTVVRCVRLFLSSGTVGRAGVRGPQVLIARAEAKAQSLNRRSGLPGSEFNLKLSSSFNSDQLTH